MAQDSPTLTEQRRRWSTFQLGLEASRAGVGDTLKAVIAAGVRIERVELEGGKVTIIAAPLIERAITDWGTKQAAEEKRRAKGAVRHGP